MQESEVKARIVDRMSILDSHVSGRVAHGLLDATAALEVLYAEVLNLTRGWNLSSTNFPARNFPAVDLHDPVQRLAVQVTVTCDSGKITETQKTFERHNLGASYSRLVFVGIRSTTQSKNLASWAEVFSQSDLLNLENLNLSQLVTLDDRLAQSIQWHRFTQQSDQRCFEVVLGVVNRDAIRHMTHVEGDFDDMLTALRQIKQVINQGEIPGTSIIAKPLSLYAAPYIAILEEIDTRVGRMSSIVKRDLQPHNFLPYPAAREVDIERVHLIDSVNAFCMANQHDGRIHAWGG